MFCIQTKTGELWSHKSKRWIESKCWLTWSQCAIKTECGYATFVGCNRVANALLRKSPDLSIAIARATYLSNRKP